MTWAIEAMKARLAHPPPLDDLARVGGFSPAHFHRIFRDVTALTPARFLAALRMAEAARLLVHSPLRVVDVSWRVGYESLGTFTTQFGRLVGASPARFRGVLRRLRHACVGELLANTPDQPGARALVVRAVGRVGSLPDSSVWWVAAATAQVRAAQPAGEYAVFSVIVDEDVLVADVVVDGVPDSYLIDVARVSTPAAAAPLTPRRPLPTDPPVLTLGPSHWLAERAAVLLA